MIIFSKQDLKNLCYNNTFEKGEEYYKKNKIFDFSIENIKDEYGNPAKRVFSKIYGSNEQIYDCVAVFTKKYDEKLNLPSCFCNCLAFQKYNGICKHLVAVLLKYIDINIKNTNNNMKESIEISSFINSIKQDMYSINSIKTELSVDTIITFNKNAYYNNEISLELKIGEEKKYVVKNMRNFIESILFSNNLEFSKSFTYAPYCHTFKKEDEPIIQLIQEIYETQINLENNGYYNNSIKLFKEKKVYLNNLQFKRLLSYLENRSFTFKFNDNLINNITLTHENLPVQLEISGNDKNLLLLQKNSNFIPLTTEKDYFLYNNKIYVPDKSQIIHYIHFHNKFLKKNPIVIPKNNWGEFSQYVIPYINKITPNIEIKDSIKTSLIKEPLETNIYLDKIDDSIISNLEFKYGFHTINPLSEKNNNDLIIIREREKEYKILNTLKKYGFQKDNNLLILSNEEAIVNFISNGITKLQNICNMFYSDSFKNIKIHGSSIIKSSLKINKDDFLEISFNLNEINNEELSDIFNSIKIKKNYHKLKNGDFLLLNSNYLENFVNTLDYLGISNSQLSDNKILINKYNCLYLDEKFKNNEIVQIEENSKFKETINNFKKIKESEFKAPLHIENILRDYQKIGFKWLKTLAYYGFGGILADEMGLGKTLQAIAFIASRDFTDKNNPVLIVCPTSLIYNWESEIKKFAPELKIKVICGSKNSRMQELKNIKNSDVLITSYPLIRIDIEEYKKLNFSYCFLDEAQAIKNPSSQSSHAVKELKAKGRFALTGTPIENSLTELWSIFDFLMPGYLLKHNKFKKLYENPILKNNNTEALKELNDHIRPFILRRRKNDVIKELPKKIEHTVIIDLCDEQKKLYTSYVKSFKDQIENDLNQNDFNKNRIKILSLLTRLRQLCCHPSIFIENYQGKSSKIIALLDILDNVLAENHRVLIFSQFTSMLKNIAKELQHKNINYMYLDGSIKSSDRMSLVNQFNEGKCNVFLISLKAGGTGLNLTGADTVIHFDPWWNPAVEDQASDRAHRIGQQNTVEVIKLVTKGTIEEKIQKLQEKKKNIFNNTIENASDVNIIGKMSENEIKDLFEI